MVLNRRPSFLNIPILELFNINVSPVGTTQCVLTRLLP